MISHIFAFYMLALALVPCGDGGGGIVELGKHFFDISHQEQADHERHSDNCGDDSCAPFCICSCCSSALSGPVKLPMLVKSPTPIQASVPSFTIQIIPSSFNHSIWQPPKFS